MVTAGEEQVKGVVRERYSAVARSASDGRGDTLCCAPQGDDLNVIPLYTSVETDGLPSEALMASAGCGNPTALASLKPGETVVDFGSGGGIDCFLAAKAVGPQGKVIGVDMTPDMVKLARSNARTLGLPNVEFYLTDMERTPIPDGSVDVVISNCVICLAPDKDAVFREGFRILRSGGRIFVSDMALEEELPVEVTADMTNWVSCLGGAELKTTYLERIRSAGFADVEITSEVPLENSEGWRAKVRSVNVSARKPA